MTPRTTPTWTTNDELEFVKAYAFKGSNAASRIRFYMRNNMKRRDWGNIDRAKLFEELFQIIANLEGRQAA